MFKKILVPIDGSKISKLALSKALDLAKAFDSELVLFHAIYVNTPFFEYVSTYIDNLSPEEVQTKGNQVMDTALDGLETVNIKISRKCSISYPPAAIVEEIADGIDLVVMGSRGHGPISGALVGSVTQRVLVDAPCPVLIVR